MGGPRGRRHNQNVEEGFDGTRQLKAEAKAQLDRRIRHLLAQGERKIDVARAVGVSPSVVTRVIKEGK